MFKRMKRGCHNSALSMTVGVLKFLRAAVKVQGFGQKERLSRL